MGVGIPFPMNLAGVSKFFGDKVLFEEADWLIAPGDRVGLVGANGSGKTTLLRLLAGLEQPDGGEISCPKGSTAGYLPQDGLSVSGRTVFDECLSVFADVLALETEQRELSEKLPTLPPDSDEYRAAAERYGLVHHQFEAREGYALEARVGTVLHGLGFSPQDWRRPCEAFSGGWQMRIALARLLLARPNVLLLDEPTNHLDLEARNWLEEYLSEYPHSFVIVSHDRYFLDVTVRKTVELWNRRLQFYAGNYTAYLAQREQRRRQLEAEHRNQQDRIRHLEAFINRFRYQATKAAQVQSRIKELERIKRIEIPPEEKTIRFHFPKPPASGRVVVECRGLAKAYGEKEVFRGVGFTIERGQRIALVGPNGAGKSTLIRLLAPAEDAEPPSAGEIRWGHNVRRSYFAQDQYRALDPSRRLIEDLGALAPAATQTYLRTLLGCFLFRDEDVFKPIGVLSGGERNRYAMARLLLIPANFLLLDEPTNHLDLRAKDVLLEALQEFAGSIVFVSHDRYFIDGLATRVFEVGGGNVEAYAGNYEDYLRQKAGIPLPEAVPAAPEEASPQPQPKEAAARRMNPIKRQQLEEKIGEIEEAIARIESETADLQERVSRATVYAESQELLRALEQRLSELEALYQEWEELSRVMSYE